IGIGARRKRRSPEPAAWIGWAFIAPNLVGFAVFTFFPLLFSLAISFAEWDVISGLDNIRWVGLDNFRSMLGAGDFWAAGSRTLVYAGVGVPLTTAAGLLVAMALNGPIPGRAALRLIFFIPFIANAVAIAATWILLYDPRYGPINRFLQALGIADPPLWLASSDWALTALIIMAVWHGAGYAAVIYLAALQDVPQELHEAAALDGAGTWERFKAVTFPFLTPTSFFLIITGFIGASQSFGMINLMTQGGPGQATTVLSYYVYLNAFRFYQFGYASAVAWMMFLVILVLTLLLWRVQRRGIFYG
ncbi:MAG: carbohydrate ABC transporter permease, partial [Dehalococcoidia bacterium]